MTQGKTAMLQKHYHPDFSKAMRVETGTHAIVMPVTLKMKMKAGKNEWDLFGTVDLSQDGVTPKIHAVSIAVKCTEARLNRFLKSAKGKQIIAGGKIGPVEKSTNSSENFRRIFCKIEDLEVF